MDRTYGSFYYFAVSYQRIKIRCYKIGRGYASLLFTTLRDLFSIIYNYNPENFSFEFNMILTYQPFELLLKHTFTIANFRVFLRQ